MTSVVVVVVVGGGGGGSGEQLLYMGSPRASVCLVNFGKILYILISFSLKAHVWFRRSCIVSLRESLSSF